MDTFPIVRRRDEKRHGEYRTKRRILEHYDSLAQATGDARSSWERVVGGSAPAPAADGRED
jgi:hypothetical protein